MYNTIFEMLDVKPCSLTCAEGPFVIVIDCITPNCTVSSLKPITEVLASTPGFCELVQDCIGDALEGFDYADGVNAWIQENPLSTALNISYDNSVSLLTATTVQGAIDEIVAGFCLSVSNCLVDNGLPANLDIFLLNGLQTVVGGTYDYELSSTDNIMSLLLNGSVVDTATIVNSNDLSNTGLVITSDVNGVVDSIDITSDVQALIASNTDSVTNTVTGFRVATHTAVDTTAVDINVPIATITPSTNGYTYTAIDNSTKAIVYDVIDQGTNNPKLTITVDGTLVKTIDLNQNDIQIDNAGSDFDLVDDILTFLETNGDSATISFAKYNVTVTVQPNGDQLIYQNGNLLATVYKNAIDIAYDNTTSGLTATNVQAAIDELEIGSHKSVLGDAAGSVATEITINTPIIVSTNPAQVGVLTDGTSIIIPQSSSSSITKVGITIPDISTILDISTMGTEYQTQINFSGYDFYKFQRKITLPALPTTLPTGYSKWILTGSYTMGSWVKSANSEIKVLHYVNNNYDRFTNTGVGGGNNQAFDAWTSASQFDDTAYTTIPLNMEVDATTNELFVGLEFSLPTGVAPFLITGGRFEFNYGFGKLYYEAVA